MNPYRRCLLPCLALAGTLASSLVLAQSQAPATLAAASDLKFAIEEVAARFERETRQPLRLVFGSSGNFTAQILQDAPFHLFMSADENFVYKLADAGKTLDRGRSYAVGRIGVMVPKGSLLKADGKLEDLAAALKDGRLQKFAIANPEHAPYGARAREALQHAGLWSAIQPKLVHRREHLADRAVRHLRRGAGRNRCPVAGARARRRPARRLRVDTGELAPAAQAAHGADQGRAAGGAGVLRLPVDPRSAGDHGALRLRHAQRVTAATVPGSGRTRSSLGLAGADALVQARRRHARGAAAGRPLARPDVGISHVSRARR